MTEPARELPRPVSDPAHVQEAGGAYAGHYRLIQRLGEGGFGTVWSAHQEVPVRRTVAVKILKAGMDTKQVVARFEAERQALAVMDHPCIAKVLDGGETDLGRPYFVMELVKGLPITQYCDAQRMSVRARLGLFRQVCQAVQHAHQKGIVHRDLKPSNILVALQDGKPLVKVIDFGIAKAIAVPLTEHADLTEVGQMVGTPEYMAPEQAEPSKLDIDTRADVYSLGVVLYELLTGTKPLELRAAYGKGFSEVVRAIREQDPPKPSTRIRVLGVDAAPLADQRGASPRQLDSQLRGDLDWIVMKAMEKERSRRYETVAALSDDIGRYLDNRPVVAAPPSAAYRLTKYVRRNRVAVGGAASVFLSLVAGLILTSLGYGEAREQRNAAMNAAGTAKKEASRAAEVIGILDSMLGGANPYTGRERDTTLRQLLDGFDARLAAAESKDPEVAATVRSIVGRAYRGLGNIDRAETHLGRALDLRRNALGPENPATLESVAEWLTVLHDKGEYAAAERAAREAVDIVRRVQPDSRLLAQCLYMLGIAVSNSKGYGPAVPHLREALALREKHSGPKHAETGDSLFALGCALVNGDEKERDEAEVLLQRRLDLLRELGQPNHPNAALALDNLSRLARGRGDFARAVLLLTEAVKIQEASIGDDHPDLATTLCTLGNLRSTLHEFDDAERHLERAIAIYRARLGADHPDLGIALQNLAMVKRERGDLKAAKARVEEALVILTKRLPPDDATVLGTRMSLAGVLRALGELAEAERESRSIFEARRRMFSVDSNESASSRTLLAQILTDGARAGGDASKSQEAAVLLRELLEARSKGPKAGDWRTAVAESCLADALALRGERLDEARRLAESSYESLRASSSIPGQHRDAILVDALERCVRVLEAVEAEAPGSAGDAALAAWRVKLRDARAAKDRPAEPVK